jgi:SRF-type transcription factor (DNA-binding and dimerisation domain)
MVVNNQEKRTDNLGRRKKNLLEKVYELGRYYVVDVVLIIRQNGQFITYGSIDLESFPPSMKEIVRVYLFYLLIHTNVKAAGFIPCS